MEYANAENIYYSLIKKDSTHSNLYTRLGSLKEKQRDLVSAFLLYNKAFEINPCDASNIIRLCNIGLKLPQQISSADTLLHHVNVGLNCNSNNYKLLSIKAKILITKEAYDSALLIYEHLDSIRKMSLLNYNYMGICYLRLNKYENALVCFDTLKTVSEDPLLFFRIGKCLFHTNDGREAIKYYEKALKLAEEYYLADIYINMGKTYRYYGEENEEINNYKKALETDPSLIYLYPIIAQIYEFKKQRKPAIRYYEKYLKAYGEKNEKYENYIKSRIQKLKEDQHFE